MIQLYVTGIKNISFLVTLIRLTYLWTGYWYFLLYTTLINLRELIGLNPITWFQIVSPSLEKKVLYTAPRYYIRLRQVLYTAASFTLYANQISRDHAPNHARNHSAKQTYAQAITRINLTHAFRGYCVRLRFFIN